MVKNKNRTIKYDVYFDTIDAVNIIVTDGRNIFQCKRYTVIHRNSADSF